MNLHVSNATKATHLRSSPWIPRIPVSKGISGPRNTLIYLGTPILLQMRILMPKAVIPRKVHVWIILLFDYHESADLSALEFRQLIVITCFWGFDQHAFYTDEFRCIGALQRYWRWDKSLATHRNDLYFRLVVRVKSHPFPCLPIIFGDLIETPIDHYHSSLSIAAA